MFLQTSFSALFIRYTHYDVMLNPEHAAGGFLVGLFIINLLFIFSTFRQMPSKTTASYSLGSFRVLPLEFKRPGREVKHSQLCSAEFKNEWSNTPALHMYTHGVNRENFTLILFAMKKNRYIQFINSVCGLFSDGTSSSGYTVSVMNRLRII